MITRQRVEAQADYETNVEAEAEIELIQAALTRIEDEHLRRIIELIEETRASSTDARA